MFAALAAASPAAALTPGSLEADAVAVAPRNSSRVVVLAHDASRAGGVWTVTSDDGGATWSAPVGPGRGDPPSGAAVLGSGDAMLAVIGGVTYRSVDGGAIWRLSLRTRFGVASVVASATNPTSAWAVSSLGNIYRSPDAGRTWRRVTPRGAASCTSVATQPGTSVVLATCTWNMWRSADAGRTWRLVRHLPAPRRGSIAYGMFETVVFDPGNPRIAMANGFTQGVDRARLWRSTDGGRTWRAVAAPGVSRRGLQVGSEPVRGEIRVTAGAGRVIAGPYTTGGGPLSTGGAAVILTSPDTGRTWRIEDMDPLDAPGLAAGSSTALFMPTTARGGAILTGGPSASGWQPVVFDPPAAAPA
ncbi:MAG: hypothetical protein U0Y82_05870 [Thermoleophilia bacterium]